MQVQNNPILSFFKLLKLKPKSGKLKLKLPKFLKSKPKKTKLNFKPIKLFATSMSRRVWQLRKKFVALEWEYIGFMCFDDPIDSLPVMDSTNEEKIEGWIYGD